MRFRTMLHPTHPARLALALSGLRFSITVGSRKQVGTAKKFVTHEESASYARKKKSGPEMSFKRDIIDEKAPSGTLLEKFPRVLFSSNSLRHLEHEKSSTLALFRALVRFPPHEKQNAFRSAHASEIARVFWVSLLKRSPNARFNLKFGSCVNTPKLSREHRPQCSY